MISCCKHGHGPYGCPGGSISKRSMTPLSVLNSRYELLHPAHYIRPTPNPLDPAHYIRPKPSPLHPAHYIQPITFSPLHPTHYIQPTTTGALHLAQSNRPTTTGPLHPAQSNWPTTSTHYIYPLHLALDTVIWQGICNMAWHSPLHPAHCTQPTTSSPLHSRLFSALIFSSLPQMFPGR